MNITHRVWAFNNEDYAILALVESLRDSRLLGESNDWGAPDEILLLSGGPTSELSRFSILAGPMRLRFRAGQPAKYLWDDVPKAVSPLSGETPLGPEPPALRWGVEFWNGEQWDTRSHHMGITLESSLRTLEEFLPKLTDEVPELPVIPGGLIGSLAYDLLQWTQPWRLRNSPVSDTNLGILWRSDRWLIHDRCSESLHLLTFEDDEWGLNVTEFINRNLSFIEHPNWPSSITKVYDETSNYSDHEHAEIVSRIQDSIREGQLYQLNFGRKWKGKLCEHPWKTMLRLAKENPSPFSGWMIVPDQKLAICSSSPELLMSTKNGIVCTRPIKGTRPRGESPIQETELRQELLGSSKEMAEHRMLVDLERNDIALISEVGTVEHSAFQVEAYAQVQHLVSEVKGKISKGKDVWDVLCALFPGGSITGCPKTVTIAAIDEIEGEPRSFWTGSMGYIDPRNSSSGWNILIRTLEAYKSKNNWNATIQAGGGIVNDSIPLQEVEEAKWKAAALRIAAGWVDNLDNTEAGLVDGALAIHPQQIRTRTTKSTGHIGTPNYWPHPTLNETKRPRVLFIDNLDSFSWNIVHSFCELGADVSIVSGISASADKLDLLLEEIKPTHIVLGPGPGRPKNSPITQKIAEIALNGKLVSQKGNHLPLLGICLGHQAIGEAAGMELIESPLGAVHGVPCKIVHDSKGILDGLQNPCLMTRYNSLVLYPKKLNDEIIVTAWDAESRTLPMGLTHTTLPIHAIQFHPESCGSQRGLEILSSFIFEHARLSALARG